MIMMILYLIAIQYGNDYIQVFMNVFCVIYYIMHVS